MKSELYFTNVIHQRFYPFKHRFKYFVPSLFISHEEVSSIEKKIFFFSYNKFNIFSFYEKDHGYRNGKSLKKYIFNNLTKNNILVSNLKIKIMCFPRIFGYVFNPLSIIYCFEANNLIAIFYEVKNTSNEQHTYFFASTKKNSKKILYHNCNKNFYVSPFINMKTKYKFINKIPNKNMSLSINLYDENNKRILLASQYGKRFKLSSYNLVKNLLLNPILIFKVIVAILFEALRIIYKGGKYYSREKKIEDSISFEGKL